MSKQAWQDGTWQSEDGLTLHYRDYAGPADKPAIVCIPGLTRNARDFEPVAEAFGGQWRVICVELRGRGESDYAKDSSTYVPEIYVKDLLALFEVLDVDKVVALGTSLGGILSVLLANILPQKFAGLIINDIGPVIEPAGITRIRGYVGQGGSYPTWMHAARSLRETIADAYPDFTISEWLRLAKRLMVVSNSGRIGYDYDMRIADPLAEHGEAAPSDLWDAWKALPDIPKLVLRGELSDLLSAATLQRMEVEIAELDTLTVARTGHVPTLDEPEVQAAINKLLDRLA
jgi:pimeloyl-ACP methyl ester carboxylesterase